jgi:hypothetical protein
MLHHPSIKELKDLTVFSHEPAEGRKEQKNPSH